MTILSPISWARTNVAALVGGVVFGVVSTLLGYFHVNVILGLGNALAFVLALWAMAAFHAMTGSPTPAPAPLSHTGS